MASQFAPFLAHAGAIGEEPRVYEATFLSTDTSQPGEFVFFDTADNNVKVCGADPALILGVCLGNAPSSTLLQKPSPYGTNKTPIAVLSEGVTVGLSSTTTPSAAFLMRAGGLTKVTAGGRSFWQCDTSKTAGTSRFIIVGIDITGGIFYCRFKPANLQGQAIVS